MRCFVLSLQKILFLNLLYKDPLLISSPIVIFETSKKLGEKKGKKKRKERFLILVVRKKWS